jgi:uncharacterized protein YukE
MSRQLVILGTSVTLPDPASVTDLAAGFQQHGGQLADLETALQSLTRPDAWGDWTGLAADAFGQSIGQVPAQLADISDAYEDVASALQQYAGQLEPVVSSLSSLSYQAEDAEGALAAVQNARAQAIANGQDPVTTGWNARVEDASAAVSALRGQLNRLLAELTALAATCAKQITAAQPKTAGKSLFGELERDFARDVADPAARIGKEAGKDVLDGGKDAMHLLDDMLVEPFTQLWPDLVNFAKDPDLQNAGALLGDVGAVLSVIGLVVAVIALSVGTDGAADVALAAVGGELDVATKVADVGALAADLGAEATDEDGASSSDVAISTLTVAADLAGDEIGDSDAQLVFNVGSGAEITAFSDGLTHELSVPQVAADAPDVVSGLQVTADAVQGLQGVPVAPALQPAGGVSVLQPAVSVPSAAVVNIQHMALSPQPGGAPGGASGMGGGK